MAVENVQALTAHLYHPDGTFDRDLDGALGMSYQDRNSDPGSASLVMRGSDADLAAIVPLSMVKYKLGGTIRFGARVRREQATYEENDSRVSVELLGLLGAVLSDAVVMDEDGQIRVNSKGQRWIGWMSSGYDDTVTGWITDIASTSFVWTDPAQSSARLGHPIDWPDPDAWWLHRGDFGGQYQLWRRTFTTAADAVLKMWASADEEITVYFDGEKVLEVKTDETGYTESNPTPLGIVAAGEHHVAVEWRSKVTPIDEGGDAFDGFILTICTVDDTGSYLSNVTRTDDSGNWRSYGGTWTDTRPGMMRGAAMKMLWDEAVARSCLGPSICQLGFTATHDSAGVPWADDDGGVNTAVDLADPGLDEVFISLAENHVDLGFDASTTPMTLHAWARRGSDKRATVELKRGRPPEPDSPGDEGVQLADGANVTDLTTARDHDVVTHLWGVLADGTYEMVGDAAASAAYGGRIERGTSLGNTPTGTGQQALTDILAGIVDAQDQLNLGQALWGAEPYTDYVIGDTVTAPAHRSGTGPARVTSITAELREGEDWPDVFPGLVPDPT